MTITVVKVSDKGQIAIPQSIREKIGLEKGDELVLIELDNKILLQKSKNFEKLVSDDFKDILEINKHSLNKIWNNKQDNIWEKKRKK